MIADLLRHLTSLSGLEKQLLVATVTMAVTVTLHSFALVIMAYDIGDNLAIKSF